MAASALLLYIAGYARMTGVNYQRIQILQQVQRSQCEAQLLHSNLVKQRDRRAVETWAQSHGMVLASGPAFLIQPKGR